MPAPSSLYARWLEEEIGLSLFYFPRGLASGVKDFGAFPSSRLWGSVPSSPSFADAMEGEMGPLPSFMRWLASGDIVEDLGSFTSFLRYSRGQSSLPWFPPLTGVAAVVTMP
jgi:hypothetical protein